MKRLCQSKEAAGVRQRPSNISLGFVLYQNDRFFRSRRYKRQRATIRVLSATVGGQDHSLMPDHVEIMFRPTVRKTAAVNKLHLGFLFVFSGLGTCWALWLPSARRTCVQLLVGLSVWWLVECFAGCWFYCQLLVWWLLNKILDRGRVLAQKNPIYFWCGAK